MTANPTESPRIDIDRPDVGLALASEWTVRTPERQQAAVAADAEAWRQVTWPQGLLRHDCLVGTDGSTLMHYHQWTDEEAYQEFVGRAGPERMRILDESVPGIERHGLVRYEVYDSHRAGDQARVPGCVVAVEIGADSRDRARRWVDSVIDALGTDTDSRPGLISAHFHISADGTRILNYAEWTDVQEHVKALDNADNSVGRGSAWDTVRNAPGITSLGLTRYRPGHSLVAPFTTSARP